MQLEQYNFSLEENQENSIKDLLIKYLFHWKWFVISISIALILGVVYLRYQVPQYEVNATILIKDDKKGQVSDELTAFEDLGILKNTKNIDNEIEILRSRSLMTKVVNELKLNITYYSFGRPIEHERYNDAPFLISYTLSDSTIIEPVGNWIIEPISNNRFLLKSGENEEEVGEYYFGDSIDVSFGKIVISNTKNFSENYLNKDYRIIVSSVEQIVNKYLGLLKVNAVNKTSNAITISLRDAIIQKAIDIVDNLIKQHNLDALADKNQVSQNTASFINERIQFITNELSGVEGEAESFKTKHKLTDVESEAKLFLQTSNESEMSLLENSTQLRIAEFMNDYLKKLDKPNSLIPSNLGLSDHSLSNEINDYNRLVLERNRLVKTSGEKNPVVENLDYQIIGLRNSIKESLMNLYSTLQIKAKNLATKEIEISNRISSVPKYEREFRMIQRQQQIKESLYLYLLQKREETNIALAVTVANAKVLDKAYSNGGMVAPQKITIYLSSILIGIIFPIVVLYILEILDTKIHGKKEIDQLKLPYLGEIPDSINKEKLIVRDNVRSNTAEAFRILRGNVEFLCAKVETKSKVILVTSTVAKEGKSYIALNLAASFALTGKKVLLIGSDLRNPKILKYLNLGERNGLTNLIIDQNMNISDMIFPLEDFSNLDILNSGPIPPNPAELLMYARVKEIFDYARENYEYVIVDTAPIGLVADTLLISKYADATVFIARANVLDKRLLRIVDSLNKEKRLPNVACLINGSSYTKGYGYGYGAYGYYGSTKEVPLWKRLLKAW